MSSRPLSDNPPQQEMVAQVRDYFLGLQNSLCIMLSQLEPSGEFTGKAISTPQGGLAQPRVLAVPWDASHQQYGIEKAAVQFSHSLGDALPPAATQRNPELAGLAFQAMAISVIVHPHNPYVPTCHMNVRFFVVDSSPATWYFGGGYDLTPYYGYIEDARHWHETAQRAVGAHYPTMKAACDDYFYLDHRQEPRGIGGLFFDDWTEGGFTTAFDLVTRVGNSFAAGYQPIFERRAQTAYGPTQRLFQTYRRGRYAEFNLVQDRGTRYGLQSGRRIESVLASLPPEVRWEYDYQAHAGSPEAALTEQFLPVRDWLHAVDNSGD